MAPCPGQRRPPEIDADVARVRTLEITDRGELSRQDRLGRSPDMARHGLEAEVIIPVAPAVGKIDPPGISGPVKSPERSAGRLPVDGRDHPPEDRRPAVPVLLDPGGEIIGQRLHGHISVNLIVKNRGGFPRRDRFHEAEGESRLGLSRQLERPQDRRGRRHVDETRAPGRELGGAADPPGIKKVVEGKIAVSAREPEIEKIPALDEKRALLLKKRLERRQVDHGGIGLDLPEIGIDGQVQRQVARHPDLAVQSAPQPPVPAGGEGISRDGTGGHQASDRVRHDLDLVRRGQTRQPFQLAEKVNPAWSVSGNELPLRGFVGPKQAPEDLEPPFLLVLGPEPKLGERDPHLGRPALIIRGNGRVPNGIPAHVFFLPPGGKAVVCHNLVGLDPGGVDREDISGQMVVEAVESDQDHVPAGLIPAAEALLDQIGPGIMGPDADVNIFIIVKNLERRLFRGFPPLVGISLDKAAFPGSVVPGGLDEPAVDDRDAFADPDRPAFPDAGNGGRAGEDRPDGHGDQQSGSPPEETMIHGILSRKYSSSGKERLSGGGKGWRELFRSPRRISV